MDFLEHLIIADQSPNFQVEYLSHLHHFSLIAMSLDSGSLSTVPNSFVEILQGTWKFNAEKVDKVISRNYEVSN